MMLTAKRQLTLFLAVFILTASAAMSAVSRKELTPVAGGADGACTTETVQGRKVWVPARSLYFKVPDTFSFKKGEPVYVRIEYLDTGFGHISVEYDSACGGGEPYRDAEIHTRSSRIGTGQFVYSYQVFEVPRCAGSQNNAADFRISLQGGDKTPLRVASVEISNAPYDDRRLEYVQSRPWLKPYEGPVKDFVDNRTVAGKVLAGYQGWFRAPNDFYDTGWRHWGGFSTVEKSRASVDMWPYLDDYSPDQLYPAGDVVCKSGAPARLFSSADPETVRQHFRWMRKYNIDGVYLQRFVCQRNSGFYGAPEFVLNNVRQAAAQEGRVWAIEYDVSSLSTVDNALEIITNDWRWLVDKAGILNDPRYIHENGKPVLFIWGFAVRDFTVEQANAIVDYFSGQNLYLIGGVPGSWQKKPEWFDHFRRYDQMLGWMTRSGTDLEAQQKLLAGWNRKILPHAWPGFSWCNLKKLPPGTSYTPRNGGEFYWTRLYNAIHCGADHIFLGMFDEYDEGTAIMPMSDDHPLPPAEYGQFINNEGRDPFWYLRLSGAAREILNGFRPLSSNLPPESALSEPAFAGEDATVYLGAENKALGLVHVQPDDGKTAGAVIGGHPCRTNLPSGTGFYFNVDDRFCSNRTNGQPATIEIEFYDSTPGTQFALEYDGLASAYTRHPKAVAAPGKGGWKNIRWNITDGLFAGRQSGGADFRIVLRSGEQAAIRRVSVFLPEARNGRENAR